MPHRSVASAVACVTLAVALVVPLFGCGSVTNSQVIARDRATTTACDWYQMCNQIGPGLKYENRDSCDTQVRAQWDQAWPPAMCDSKINQTQLTTCLNAIQSTLCTNAFDILNTLANKCPESSICSGP